MRDVEFRLTVLSAQACPSGQQKERLKPCPLGLKSTNGHASMRTSPKRTDGDLMRAILYAR